MNNTNIPIGAYWLVTITLPICITGLHNLISLFNKKLGYYTILSNVYFVCHNVFIEALALLIFPLFGLPVDLVSLIICSFISWFEEARQMQEE